jgi:hypothetical protein
MSKRKVCIMPKNIPAYRATLSAKLGRDSLEFGRCLCHMNNMETAMFYLLHAVEALAEAIAKEET